MFKNAKNVVPQNRKEKCDRTKQSQFRSYFYQTWLHCIAQVCEHFIIHVVSLCKCKHLAWKWKILGCWKKNNNLRVETFVSDDRLVYDHNTVLIVVTSHCCGVVMVPNEWVKVVWSNSRKKTFFFFRCKKKKPLQSTLHHCHSIV